MADVNSLKQVYNPGDGSNDKILGFQPGAGELWYIEQIQMFCDGSGSGGAFGIQYGVVPSELVVNTADEASRGLYSNESSTYSDDSIQSAAYSFGAYIGEGQRLEVWEKGDTGTTDSADWYLMINARRVL